VGPARQLPRAEGDVASGRFAAVGWARHWAGSRAGERRKRKEGQLGSGCLAGGLVAH
jgi:hypothetical protein